jgi:hypothetical protein
MDENERQQERTYVVSLAIVEEGSYFKLKCVVSLAMGENERECK